MEDPERLGGILFFSLLGLTIVILVLGVSVKVRLARIADTGIPVVSTAVIALMALMLAFFSIFTPSLAAFPALLLLIRGLQVLIRRGVLDRDGGIMIVLAGLAWALLVGIQASLLAWGKTVAGAIRVDIVVTIPAMVLLTSFVWWIQSALPGRRSLA